ALEQGAIAFVHAGLFDLDGVFREKRLPAALAQRYLVEGWSFIDALPFWGPGDGVRGDRAWRSEPCAIDAASLRPYPFEPDSVLLVADYTGPSRALSPRALLEVQIARAADMGLQVVGASEFEFILLAETSASVVAKAHAGLATYGQENRCWSGYFPATAAALLAEYDAMLAHADIPLHHWCSELGPGCLEAALPARPLLRAADDAALFKLFTKAFFTQRDLTASFMAQLSDDHPGLGGHPIVSLTDSAGAPLLADPARASGLSPRGEAFLAGLLHAMPELTAMFAGTVNAYRRYAPGNWAPRTATWGRDNYTCGVRVVASPAADARIEFRLPGADMAPHLAFAMVLGAGLDGIEAGLPLPPETTGIGRTLVHEAIGPLPRTLLEAAERFVASARARRLFGDAFVDHYAASRIAEDEALRRHVSACERARYLFHV
ncbi:MAG: glutamine synthetase family protein, partial [Gammaproteobacteria bacterium]